MKILFTLIVQSKPDSTHYCCTFLAVGTHIKTAHLLELAVCVCFNHHHKLIVKYNFILLVVGKTGTTISKIECCTHTHLTKMSKPCTPPNSCQIWLTAGYSNVDKYWNAIVTECIDTAALAHQLHPVHRRCCLFWQANTIVSVVAGRISVSRSIRACSTHVTFFLLLTPWAWSHWNDDVAVPAVMNLFPELIGF